MSFHEVRFPTAISRGATGGPERRTEIVVLGSGREERNSRWSDARRRYNIGLGLRNLDDLHAVIEFFEERRGRLFGFRLKDHADFTSTAPRATISPTDQTIAVADGIQATFQLTKRYGGFAAPYDRPIVKPVSASVRIAVDGNEQTEGVHFSVAPTTGLVTFELGFVPTAGALVTAGFEFDVPVRFDSDTLELNIRDFEHGSLPAIPIVEVRP